MAKRKLFNTPVVGVEAINFMGSSSSLREGLIRAVEYLRNSKTYTRSSINLSGIEQIIYDNTGMSVNFVIDTESPMISMFVRTPDIDRNNPMLNAIERHINKNSDISSMMRIKSSNKIGKVDLVTGKVSGVYSELPVDIFVTSYTLACEFIPVDAIAAGIIHELGHPFSFFERILDTCILNISACSTTERILGTTSTEERVRFISEFERLNEVSIDTPEVIAASDDKGLIFTKLILTTLKERRNENGEEYYNWKGWEASADQFATRHGAGSGVAVLTDLMDASFDKLPRTLSLSVQMFFISTLAFASGTVMGVLTGNFYVALVTYTATVAAIASVNPYTNVYDSYKDRLARIYREYTVALKDRDISAETRAFYIVEQNTVKKIMDKYNEHISVQDVIWSMLTPLGNRATKEKALQQEIESLEHNNLYRAAALF